MSANQLLANAARAQQANRPDEAERFARQVLDLDPSSVAAKFLIGMACARKGDARAAVDMLSQVLTAEPRSYETIFSLAAAHRDLANFDEAIALALQAIRLQPRDPQAHNLLGRCYLAARKIEEACSQFEAALQINPKYVAALFNMGKAKQMGGRDGDAAAAFAAAVEIKPSSENLLAYGQSLLALTEVDQALRCARLCVERFPESAAAHLLLCGALTELNCFEDARECLEQAISLDVDGKEALQIAQRQRPLGLIDDANQNLRRAIRTNPRLVQAYDTLIQNQRTTEDDRGLVEHMEALLADRRLAAIETISLHYALGKAREELGEFQDSAHHLDEANRLTRDLKFGETRFDRDRYAAHVDELIREFLPMARSSIAWSTCQERLPILIVGMMRSGTTLAEQILSSHPAVGAAGEQLFWTRNWRRTLEAGAERSQMVAQLGQEYVQFLGGLCPGVARVTDKMPGNCMFAGLIHAALPQAKIVHMRRNPLDNCLSIWATPNQMPHEGGHVKDEIVFVYRQYLRLMEETRRSIPPERLLEIDYEELVADQEATTRRMLEFCELEWDERCLRPEDNTRTVLTPSAWQVRQPVYRTSVARWRNFEPYLGPFGDLIGLEHPRGLA